MLDYNTTMLHSSVPGVSFCLWHSGLSARLEHQQEQHHKLPLSLERGGCESRSDPHCRGLVLGWIARPDRLTCAELEQRSCGRCSGVLWRSDLCWDYWSWDSWLCCPPCTLSSQFSIGLYIAGLGSSVLP
eukprot:3263795-Rhodomonas_salina.2